MYINLSRTIVVAPFSDGVRGLFEIQPQHMPREDIPESIFWPAEHGRMLAIEAPEGHVTGNPLRWHQKMPATIDQKEMNSREYKIPRPTWEIIADHKTLALIDRMPEFKRQDEVTESKGE